MNGYSWLILTEFILYRVKMYRICVYCWCKMMKNTIRYRDKFYEQCRLYNFWMIFRYLYSFYFNVYCNNITYILKLRMAEYMFVYRVQSECFIYLKNPIKTHLNELQKWHPLSGIKFFFPCKWKISWW